MLVRGLDNLPAEGRGGVLTIGNFDGVHLGHQRILSAGAELAKDAGVPLCVGTFDPSPASLLAPEKPPELIVPPDLKYPLLREHGADVVVVLQTTAELLSISAEEFVREVIAGRFRPRHVVEGPGFSFGRSRSGNVALLREMAAECGFEVTEVPAAQIELPGEGPVRVSSSLIRRLILRGDVAGAARCLTRSFVMRGRVVAGQRRGRLLEFPTANVDYGRLVCPGDGVYAARVELGGWTFPAAVSIGTKPTFGQAPRAVEVHLIGADGDFYARTIAVAFLARLRDQRKFPDVESLRSQIAKDVERVRELCG